MGNAVRPTAEWFLCSVERIVPTVRESFRFALYVYHLLHPRIWWTHWWGKWDGSHGWPTWPCTDAFSPEETSYISYSHGRRRTLTGDTLGMWPSSPSASTGTSTSSGCASWSGASPGTLPGWSCVNCSWTRPPRRRWSPPCYTQVGTDWESSGLHYGSKELFTDVSYSTTSVTLLNRPTS